MATGPRRVAAFRRRLAARLASWAIELPARRRITLDLTQEQQAALGRAIHHVVPSLTLVLTSEAIAPNGHALACLNLRPRRRARARRRTRRRTAR